jgi:hypothetical protein
MFWSNNEKQIKRAEKLNKEFILRILAEQDMKKALEEQAIQQQKIDDENRDAPFVIDWNKLEPFSVERANKNGIWYTVIGYFLNGNVKEWQLNCSVKRHYELAEQFKAYKETKKK